MSLSVHGPDWAGEFLDVLSSLCSESLAVTVERRSGAPFDAVLLACDRRVLIYEDWSDALGMPTGELAVIDVDEIDAVRVSY
jgi:hypothetical protein